MAAATTRPAATVGGISLIVVCFLGSAALRLTESGAAIAQEIGALAQGSGTAAAPAEAPAEDPDLLLGAIRERSAQIAAEEARLADRAQTLAVAETRIAEQLAALEQARADLEATLSLADQASERDIERMTVVYENMKPTDAARIFERMDVSFAAGLMARMKPEIAAQVLAGMNADAAYAVTLTISSRNARVPVQ